MVNLIPLGSLSAPLAEISEAVADAAEVQMSGVELDYSERITNFTSNSTSSPGTLITGLGVSVTGNGRPVDIEFGAFQAYHSIPGTTVIFMLMIAGSPFFFGITRSPVNPGGDTVYLKRRLIVPNGVTWAFNVGVYGGAAGTCNVLRDSTNPTYLMATSR